MRQSRAFYAAMAIVLAGCAPVLHAQSAGSCRPADQTSALVQSELTGIATGTDSLSQSTRDSTGIPATTVSKISLVTDSRTCDKAAQAINTLLGTPSTVRQVYVIKVDATYAVVDPALSDAPGATAVFVFDRRWTHKDTMLP